ncbi:hypothetical protein M427DRAFT_392115 [Gonapodya prolifera JEL478]|uniref:MYND-type domain-containing protein n=1 Tax=Gonapodya prolifera (strain JEL478) TaxID=1344416 RepID=A0A139A7L3_GONPJ|nr:hypothetical protein M427DRAFT_392115 [Gonapodya prolifera JEL478]|eukprot:KXS12782.1 hypothetical protein M427DRAFT_392115 [Gonapodya prolifera JEL478]
MKYFREAFSHLEEPVASGYLTPTTLFIIKTAVNTVLPQMQSVLRQEFPRIWRAYDIRTEEVMREMETRAELQVQCYNVDCPIVGNTKSDLKKCSRCKAARYCSVDCQKQVIGVAQIALSFDFWD